MVEAIPASTSKMDEIKMATAADTELLSVMKLVKRGHIGKVPLAARAYVQVKSELSEHDGLILRRSRIVMPRSMRDEILQKIHDWHRGLNKCRERACSTLLELQELAQQIDFQHCTSSPQHHQSNWHAEQALQTAKKILKQKDPVMALMVCRSTSCSTTGFNLWWRLTTSAHYFSHRHGARLFPALQPGDIVLSKLDHDKSWSLPVVISGESTTPRSFIIRAQQSCVVTDVNDVFYA